MFMRISSGVFLLLFFGCSEVFSQIRIGVFYTPALNVTRFRSREEALQGPSNRLNFSSEVGLGVDVPFLRYHFSPNVSFISRRNSLSTKTPKTGRRNETHRLQYIALTLPLRLTTEEYHVGVMGTRFLFVVGPKTFARVYHFPEPEEEGVTNVVQAFNVVDVGLHTMAGVEVPIGLETKAVVALAYTVGLVDLDGRGSNREKVSLRNTVFGLSVGIIF